MNSNFEELGYDIFDNVIDDNTFSKLKFLSELYIKRTLVRQNNTGNVGINLFRTENLLFDFPLPELINNEIVYDTVKLHLGNNFYLQELYFYFSLPNNSIQELHKDGVTLFSNINYILPPHIIAVQFPLINFNSKSGGTRIVPKSHLSFEEPTRIENENINLIENYTPVVSKQGCIIRDARAWHGAGVNTSTEIRTMCTLAFTKAFIGQPFAISKDLFFCIDKKKRHMVTYA